MVALLDFLPLWLKEWSKVYLLPFLKARAWELLWVMTRGGLDVFLLAALSSSFVAGSQTFWERRYLLNPTQQAQVARWASVSAAVARLEDVPPAAPLVLWYKEAGMREINPDNCEGIMGLHTAVTSGRIPCFSPGPIDAVEAARQLRLGARTFKEHCPAVHYSTVDPELLKRCYMYYNAGSDVRLNPDRSGYVMNGYDEAHRHMYHVSEKGEVVRLQIPGAWPVHLAVQMQMAHLASSEAPAFLIGPVLTFWEVRDRLWAGWVRLRHPTLKGSTSAPSSREVAVAGGREAVERMFRNLAPAPFSSVNDACFSAPRAGGDPLLRPSLVPLLASLQGRSEPECGLLPGVDLEPVQASLVLAPLPGQLTRYVDQWGYMAVRVENDEWIAWLTGLRSFTASPGMVEAGQPVGAIGGPGSRTSAVHFTTFDKVSNSFVDPAALLPVESHLSNNPADHRIKRREETMNLWALIPFIPLLLGLFWAVWLFFKKDLLSKGPVQVITYFIGVILALWVIGWLVDTFLPQWVARRLSTAQQSEDIQMIQDVSRDIWNSTLGVGPAPSPQPIVYTPTPVPPPPPAPTSPPPQPSPAATSPSQPPSPVPTATSQPPPAPTEKPAAVPPTSSVVQPASGESTYIVKTRDTLSSIARQFGVSVQALQQRNNLADPGDIKIGQQLIIPVP